MRRKADMVRTDSAFELAPYYLVWMSESGEVQVSLTEANKILDLFKNLFLDRSWLNEHAVACFSEASRDRADKAERKAWNASSSVATQC